MRYAILSVVFFSFVPHAQAESGLNFTVKTGVSAGTVYTPNKAAKSKNEYSIGAVGLHTSLQKNISPAYSLELGYGILLDIVNSQVSRQGARAGIIYNLYGGAIKMVQGDDAGLLVSRSQTQFSLVFLGSSESYSLAAKNLSLTISGSVNEAKAGFYARRNNWGAELLVPMISISSSSSQVTTRIVDFNLIYII